MYDFPKVTFEIYVHFFEGPAHLSKLALKAPRLSKPAIIFPKITYVSRHAEKTPKRNSRASETFIFNKLRSIK